MNDAGGIVLGRMDLLELLNCLRGPEHQPVSVVSLPRLFAPAARRGTGGRTCEPYVKTLVRYLNM